MQVQEAAEMTTPFFRRRESVGKKHLDVDVQTWNQFGQIFADWVSFYYIGAVLKLKKYIGQILGHFFPR
jgi:hypothetical protein